MRRARREALFVAGLSLLAVPATAGADPGVGARPGAPTATTAPPTAAPPAAAPAGVEIFVVGSPAVFERVRALGPRRPAAPIETTWSRVEAFQPIEVLRAGPPRVVRCWLDLRQSTRARLYFSAAASDRFLVREVELSGRFDALDRAALAEVLELSIEALIENDRAGLSRAEAEALLARRPPPPPSPRAPPPVEPRSPLASAPSPVRQRTHLEWGGFYAVQALGGDGAVGHGPGASVALAGELERGEGGRRSLSAWAQGQYRFPVRASGAGAAVRLDTVAVRVGVELATLRWHARLGLGADLVHIAPEAISSAVAPAAVRWSSSIVVTAALGAQLRIASRWHLSLRVLADLLPVPVDYGVTVDGRLAPVFSPWRFRPGLAVELVGY